MISTRPLSISLVTPNFNGADFLRNTIESVLGQDYPELEYVIADGGSTDGSRLIIEQYRDQLSAVLSEPDNGHADSLNKGFSLTSGEIMGWINSDDVLHPHCLTQIDQLFRTYPQVEWVTGRPSAMNAVGEIDYVGPPRPWSRLRFLSGDHLWIQQESTFWRRSLWQRAGGNLDTQFSVANDFDLWARFFRHAALYSFDQMLGCFRQRPGQRSVELRKLYDREVHQVLSRELNQLEPGFRQAFAKLLPDRPRTLTPVQRASLEPELRVADPPLIRAADMRSGRSLQGGGSRFGSNLSKPEPVSDLSHLRGIHQGERCFILGNGPSLNETDLSALDGETVFACNAAFLLFDRINWRPRYYTCVDSRVLPDRAPEINAMLGSTPEMTAFFPAELQEHGGVRRRFSTREFIPEGPLRYFFNEEPGTLDCLPYSMFSLNAAERVIQPHTVAITMLQLAAYMGFSEIYLVGCDMRYTIPEDVLRESHADAKDPRLLSAGEDRNHFDASYFGPGRKWHVPNVNLMREHFRIAREALESQGIAVYNATAGGDLDVFERVDLGDVVQAGAQRGKAHQKPSTSSIISARPRPSLTSLRFKAVGSMLRNNVKFLLGVGALGIVALGLGAAFAEARIWIALASATGLSIALIVGVAIKMRRIVTHLMGQLRLIQTDRARMELEHQAVLQEVERLKAASSRQTPLAASDQRDEASAENQIN